MMLQDVNGNKVVALLGASHVETDFDTAGLFESGRSGLGVAGETLCPVLADLGENGADIVRSCCGSRPQKQGKNH